MSNFVRKKITRCLIYDFRPREYELCVALNDILCRLSKTVLLSYKTRGQL